MGDKNVFKKFVKLEMNAAVIKLVCETWQMEVVNPICVVTNTTALKRISISYVHAELSNVV